ncbi:CIC11C00000005157 [Sungouiella intermedia]|uniref:CIC11C00000005157 n=1 Tax=Sungouiella intermedia TaxID=45354 RepID=A0A1L0BS60_9ASCO|nr:CIC11C00000005157 [[Candida] intermedia]
MSSSKYVVLPQEAHTTRVTEAAGQSNDEHFDIELDDLDSLDYEISEDIEHNTETGENLGTSSMKMAFMNMANSILGAGIIGQPFAFRNSGLIGGLVVVVLLTFLIDWTLRLIVINAQMSQTKSYQDTVNFCFGKWGRILLLVTISSFAYGGCMAFCVIIGDTIPHVLKLVIPESITNPDTSVIGWLFGRNVIICIFTACISYPLSLNRDISKLAKASGFALVGMLIIVLVAVIRGPFVDSALRAPLTKLQWTVNVNIFQGISVISFALVCHHNTIFIYQSLKNATVSKFAKLTHWACGVSMCFCILMGVSGLLNFGANTKGNILNNFKSNDFWANVARFCFGLNMLTTFPLEIFVVRDVLKDIVLIAEDGGSTAHLELSSRQHFIITTVLVFSSMSVSLFTCNLGMILELIGATSASLMAYIIPPLCYLKLCYDKIDYKTATSGEKRDFLLKKAIPSVLCTLFGFCVMFISSYKTIANSISGNDGDSHCVID